MRESNCMLTTFDNPYNPFADFRKWYMYDTLNGYNSSELVARLARTSDELTDEENEAEVERVINDIIKNDILNIYCKIWK